MIARHTRALLLSLGATMGCATATTTAAAAPAASCPSGPITVSGSTGGYASIQCAVDGASAGSIITIPAGTYIGQVFVDKPVTLTGAGQGQTVIASPAHDQLVNPYTESGYTALPIVYVGPDGGDATAFGGGATIQQLTVDASDMSGDSDSCARDIQGIAVVNASATIQDVTVQHTRLVPTSGSSNLAGCQAGLGIAVQNDLSGSTATSTVDIDDDTVDDYQKDGILLVGPNLAFNVNDDTIADLPSAAIASNGLEIDSGATGTAAGDTIAGNECDLTPTCGADARTDTQAGGVITFDSGDVTLSDDVVVGNDFGVAPYNDSSAPATVTVTGSTLIDRYEGVLAGEGAETIAQNTISGADIGVDAISFGPTSGYSGDNVDATVSLTGNTLSGNSQAAIRADNEGASPYSPQITARANRIVGNGAGAVAGDTPVTLNLADNWWGCNGGPGAAGCDTVAGTGASASPWLQLTVGATPASIAVGGGQVGGVIATVSRDSSGATVDTSQFPPVAVTLSSSLGSLATAVVTLTAGSAASVLMPPSAPGSAEVTATLDGASATSAVTFAAPAPANSGTGQGPGSGNQGVQGSMTNVGPTGPTGPSGAGVGTGMGTTSAALTLKTATGAPLRSGTALSAAGGALVLGVANTTKKAVLVTLALHARIGGRERVIAHTTVRVAARGSAKAKLALDAGARTRLAASKLTVTLDETGGGPHAPVALTLDRLRRHPSRSPGGG